MNPIIVSAAFGLVKGVILNEMYGPAHASKEGSFAEGVVLGPIAEEFQFRALPFLAAAAMGTHAPKPGWTALPFGLAHASPKHDIGWNAFRVTDAALGGLLYEHSYRRYGFWGAVAAHSLHNLFVSLPSGGAGIGLARRGRRG